MINTYKSGCHCTSDPVNRLGERRLSERARLRGRTATGRRSIKIAPIKPDEEINATQSSVPSAPIHTIIRGDLNKRRKFSLWPAALSEGKLKAKDVSV